MIASSKKLSLRREVDIETLELENGNYAIIPWFLFILKK